MTTPVRVDFVVGGVQKGGTTALASFMARNPALALPDGKEAHVFDAPAFEDTWSAERIDRTYARHFERAPPTARVYGDATPIYVLHPLLIGRIARYNPAMRWILILRHPVERAISHYRMERARGEERWPMWPALLLERWRLRGHGEDFSKGSPLRRYSYRLRGDYARQLDALYSVFPREQVLVLRNEQLAEAPRETLSRVYAFLGVPDLEDPGAFERVFEGDYRPLRRGAPEWRLLRWLMRQELDTARRRHGISWD